MNAEVSIRTLRRRWKPHKERLLAHGTNEAALIRFHRCCSWLARVEQMEEDADLDHAMLSLWIAFNSLYGQWDETRREPRPDRECWRKFVDRIVQLDRDSLVIAALQEHKRLAMSLLEDKYLSGFFWQDPSTAQLSSVRKARSNAQSWYVERRWTMLVEALMSRIYLVRCQLVHGAATYGGQLNRTSLRHCMWMLPLPVQCDRRVVNPPDRRQTARSKRSLDIRTVRHPFREVGR